MIDCKFYLNVGRLMDLHPRPTRKCTLCTLNSDRLEQLDELEIISISAVDGDYYDGKIE